MGSASMLRRTWGLYGFTTTSKLANFLLKANEVNLSVNELVLLTKFAQPDLTISVNTNNVGSDDVYSTTFHECAHASHWSKVGNSYWVKYINYIITYGAYGDETGKNAGYCGVGEMWGNYFGNFVCCNECFGSCISNWKPYKDWFNPGFLKLVEDIPDVTTTEIFGCLTSDIHSISGLKNKLKTITNYDEEVDYAYGCYNDCP